MTTVPTVPAVREAEAASTLDRGSVVGRFVILEVLGQGGMGTVFAAHDAALDRLVALKVVRGERDLASQARLVREAKAMARVQHPAIVAVHDVGTDGTQVFVAMELVRGTTVRRWLDDQPRAWREILAVFLQAGRGLEAAHAASVIHRDFKPENVLIDDAGRVKVADFGLADVLAGEDGRVSPSAGTLWYMAPEQLTGGASRAADARTDQFSFCVALWHGVFGAHPFATCEDDLVATVTRGELRPAPPGPPPWLAQVLARGLARDPSERHGSLGMLLDELERRAAPRRSLVVAVLALCGVGAAVAIAAVAASSDAPNCALAGSAADAAWSGARRAEVTRALGSAASASVAVLDAYVDGLRRQRVELCRATHERGEQSAELLDLRMHCLDRRLGELGALIDVLVSGDREAIAWSSRAVGELVPVSVCADVPTLSSVVPAPREPWLAARIENARRALAAIRADRMTGRYGRGYAAAGVIGREAASIGYQPLIAEVELMRAALAQATDQLDVAEQALYAAITAGEEGRVGDVRAQAWLDLVWLVGEVRGRYEEAWRLARLGRGAVERYTGAPALAATLAERLGVLALRLGKLDEAAPDLERAYALRRSMFGELAQPTIASLQHLAGLAAARGDHVAAIERHRRVVDSMEQALGKLHPASLDAVGALGAALVDAGRSDEAHSLIERGLATAERALGSSHTIVGRYCGVLGLILGERGDHERAVALQRRALAISEATYGPDSSDAAETRADLARALQGARRLDELIAVARELLAYTERTAGPTSPAAATQLRRLGALLVETGHRREALPSLQRALAIAEHTDDEPAARELRALIESAARTR